MLFQVRNIEKNFYQLIAVNKVNMEVKEGEIVGLIGPNGSGKSTLLNCLTNFINKDGGDIRFKGDDITDLSSFEIALKGIVRTFQITKIFSGLTVIDNMILGVQEYQKDTMLKRFFNSREIKIKDTVARKKGHYLLDFLGIDQLAEENAGNLSEGQKKLLSLGIALMPDPELIMLDEPTAGVNPIVINKLSNRIKELRNEGKSFVIIEHDMPFVMDLCDRILVLDAGKKIAEGSPEEIQSSERVLEAYLGQD